MPIPGEVWTDGIAQILNFLDTIQLLPMDVVVTYDRIPLVNNSYNLTYIGIKLLMSLVFPLLQLAQILLEYGLVFLLLDVMCGWGWFGEYWCGDGCGSKWGMYWVWW